MNISVKFTFIILISVFNFAGCRKNNTTCDKISFSNVPYCESKDILSEVEIIPLTFSDINYPKNIKNFYVFKDKTIVQDIRNYIFIFDPNGFPLSNSVGKIGNGPGEYSIVTGYAYNPYSSLIEIVTPDKMLFYDDSFNYIKGVKVPSSAGGEGKKPVYFQFVYDISDSEHFIIPSGISENSDEIWLFNSESGEVMKKISFGRGAVASISMQDHCFFKSDNSILFTPPLLSKYIFEITPDDNYNLKPIYEYKYMADGEDFNKLIDFREANEKNAYQLLMSDLPIPVRTVITDKYIIETVKQGNDVKNMYALFYDRISGNVKKCHLYNDSSIILPLLGYSDNTHVYSIIEGNKAKEFVSNIERQDIKVSGKESIKDEEDFVVLKITLI